MEAMCEITETQAGNSSTKAAKPQQQLSDSVHSSLKQARNVPLVELKLENVSYAPITSKAGLNSSASSANSRTVVLKNVSTKVSPYKLTAWMGPSGSGKTSLISVAADLTRPGDLLEGSLITVNGEEGKLPKRLVGVVWQDDLLLSNLTVEENVYFAARLKTPESTPDIDVWQLVEETLEELGLSHVRNSLVGSPVARVRGISGGERKRVSVASELVVRPSLLLLDEPTSGLDATTAQALIATLKDLALIGHSIAVVIHQPRTTIYNNFDHLLLLSKGDVLYDGDPGKARTFLESCSSVAELPPETGLADWMMDIIRDDERRKDDRVLAKHWAESKNKANLTHDHANASLERRMSTLEELNATPKFNTSFWTQLKLLTQRTVKQQRGERLTRTAVILQFMYLFFTALFWWRMPNNTSWVFTRNSLLFFILVAQANGIVIAAVTVFQQERVLLARERAKKMYGVGSYFIAKTTSDMTNNVLLPMLYAMVVYWTAGYRASAVAYLKYILAYYSIFSTAQSMGLWISIIIPNMQMALVLAPPLTLFFIIMAGFYVPFDNMNPGVKWISWLSFARYGYSALIVNEYEGVDVQCGEDGASISIGATSQCPLPGEEVISGMGIHDISENYWFNIGMVLALQVVFRVAAYVFLRRSK